MTAGSVCLLPSKSGQKTSVVSHGARRAKKQGLVVGGRAPEFAGQTEEGRDECGSDPRSGAMPVLYPSILFQERALGFAMGGLVGMGVFMYGQRAIWTSTAGLADTLSGGALPPAPPVQTPPILGTEARDELAHVWNSTIDKMFGSLIASLSSKGW